MKWRRERLRESHLYLIVDKQTCSGKPFSQIKRLFSCPGIDIVQLRDKSSRKQSILNDALFLKRLLQRANILFIINDYLDVAKISDSDGIHLGQSDTSIEIARRILGKDKIIGISCHSMKQALDAQKRGADYIGIGPVFPTPTKPEYLPIGLNLVSQLKKRLSIPFFAIGDINQNNISKVVRAGARRAAVCRAVLKSANMALSVRFLNSQLKAWNS
jgi:thiamine-phosphate pyrophosphorylase